MRVGSFNLATFAIFVFLLVPTTPLIAQALPIQGTIPGADTPEAKRILAKLNSIIIDKCNFDQFDLTKILPYLTKRSKELDPEHIGVKFMLRGPYTPPPIPPSGIPIHREVSMTLEDVPLIDVLGYFCQQTDHDWKIEDDAVIVFPSPPKK